MKMIYAVGWIVLALARVNRKKVEIKHESRLKAVPTDWLKAQKVWSI
jgi:hypothetical protein